MTDLFHDALARVLVHEGGKVDHPDDPGGRTNKGITQRVYNGWRSRNSLPVRDVYQIADNEVEAIYRFQYWEPIKGDALPVGVGYVVFDGAVNSGPKQSVKWLQRALADPEVAVDGMLGAVTLSKVKANTDNDKLIAAICARRMVFLQALKTWKTFGKGWTRRVSDVKKTGQAWAMGTVGPEIEYIPGAERKGAIDDAKAAPPKAPGDLGMGGAGGVAMSGAALNDQIHDSLGPIASISWIANLLPWVIGIAVVVAVGAALYRGWAKRRADALADALDGEVA